MHIYKQCLILTTNGLVGEENVLLKGSRLETSLALSKMRVFYKIRKDMEESSFDIYTYLETISNNIKSYTLLISEILYLLNFKKKFSQRNINRIVNNYFYIVFIFIRRKINLLTIPEEIIEDKNYLNTLALSNLYTVSRFYYDKK